MVGNLFYQRVISVDKRFLNRKPLPKAARGLFTSEEIS
jgi:hypothetical protein